MKLVLFSETAGTAVFEKNMLLFSLQIVDGHAIFWEPPSRASLGKHNRNMCNVPVNDDHNGIWCGGVQVSFLFKNKIKKIIFIYRSWKIINKRSNTTTYSQYPVLPDFTLFATLLFRSSKQVKVLQTRRRRNPSRQKARLVLIFR